MGFLHLNFLNMRDILVQKIYNAHTIFHKFPGIKNWR